METKLQSESYLPGYFSMRDLNEDSNSCSWSMYNGDKVFGNGQYYNGYLPRTIADACSGYDKDIVKSTILEHEAIFKNQVYELHRLYRVQRDMMNESQRKELHAKQLAVDESLSSSPLASQITSDDARKWHVSGFSFVNAASARLSTSRVEEIHSPFSSTKGSSSQASPLPSQNGSTSKHMEMLESRPSKVRRKMFDLQRPAEEYIFAEEGEEEGEQVGDVIFSGTSSYLPNGNHKIMTENGRSLLLGNGMKSNHCHGDSTQSESCLRSRPNVADLNEPIEIDDTDTPGYVDLVAHRSSHREVQGHERAPKLKGDPLGLLDKVATNICSSNDYVGLSIPHFPTNANGRQWFSNMPERGHGKANLVSAGHHAVESSASQSVQTLLNTFPGPPSYFPSDQSCIDCLREKSGCILQVPERYQGTSNGSHRESLAISHISGPHPIASSDLAKSWSNSVSFWEKPSSSSSQKSLSAQLQPYMNPSTSMSRNSQAQTLGHSIFGNSWNCNNRSIGHSTQHGHYNGVPPGFREPVVRPSPTDYDHLNSRCASYGALERIVDHNPTKSCRSIFETNTGSTNDVNLNAVFSSISSDKLQQNLEVIDVERKNEDNLAALPWLRSKPLPKNEAKDARFYLNAGKSSFLESSSPQSGRFESDRYADPPDVKSVSCSNVVEPRKAEAGDSRCRKILGFPIYEMPHISKKEASSFPSPSMLLPKSSGGVDNSRKHMMFDMNLPWDAVPSDFGLQTAAERVSIKETGAEVANFRHQIDLNACMSEEEASVGPSFAESNVKVRGVIDLEAPVIPETDEDETPVEELLAPGKAQGMEDEHIKIAAEAIVAISLSVDNNGLEETTVSSPKASMTDSLLWFAKIICSSKEDLESRGNAVLRAKDGENNDKVFAQGLDYFESMTLKLTEIKEEDYMPKPLVPENLKFDETMATVVPTRTRKGQARRGRQRRDFQRDILPGLITLSRHEVTEDIQTFGGLMIRSNSTRIGLTRGRRRALISRSPPVILSPPPCSPLIQLEDRSLTGWGKTTRRPRRQRYPAAAGNHLPIPLT